MKKDRISYKLIQQLLSILVLALVFSGCKDKFIPKESFIKVYDDKDVNKNYFPLGIQQTSDEGYLILSAYNGWNVHILKTNKEGDMLWEYKLPAKYVHAVPNLIKRNGTVYFVCMDAVGLFTYIMQIDENAQQATEMKDYPEIQYPMAVYDNQSEVYIQNYIRTDFETGIFQLNSNMDQIVNSGSVQIFTDVEDKLVDHMNYTGKRYPFFVSVTPEKDHIVMSGFNNYSFSTIFLDANLNFTGVYNGAGYDGGLNAILPLGGSKYALSRFSFTNVFYNPAVNLNPSTIDIAESISAQGKAELDAQSPVLIQKIVISSVEYVAYLATTKSNQLLLNIYPKGSSASVGSKYIGQSVPLKACDFSMTHENGILILARVTVMGSFNRIATIKLSEQELKEMIE